MNSIIERQERAAEWQAVSAEQLARAETTISALAD
jgi:hypothetical protein